MAEVAPAEGAGDDAEQLAQQRGGGAPHRVADQLEERDRLAVTAREGPQLLAEDRGIEQLGQRDVEDRLDLGRVGRRVGATGQDADERDDLGPLDTVARWSSSPMISTSAGSRAISSSASRRAPSTGDSPGSTRPPGS